MLDRKIFIHGGAEKCGSSAIQFFLSQNRHTLAKFGFFVPDANFGVNDDLVTGNHVFFLQNIIVLRSAGDFISRLDAIFDFIPVGHSILISAENLFSTDAGFLFEILSKHYDVNFLAYIRRQDDYLISAWKQWYFRVEEDVYSWLITAPVRLGRWDVIAGSFGDILPDENFNLKVYDRAEFTSQNIVINYIEYLGLGEHLPDFVIEASSINTSLDVFTVDLLKSNFYIQVGVHDNTLIDRLLQDFPFNNRYSPISFVARQKIEDLFSFGNEKVCGRFFPNRERLFRQVKFDDYLYATKSESEAQQLKILAAMVFNLYAQRS